MGARKQRWRRRRRRRFIDLDNIIREKSRFISSLLGKIGFGKKTRGKPGFRMFGGGSVKRLRPEGGCRSEPSRKCWSEMEQSCKMEEVQMPTQMTRQECNSVPTQECRPVPRQVCEQVQRGMQCHQVESRECKPVRGRRRRKPDRLMSKLLLSYTSFLPPLSHPQCTHPL